MFQMHEHLKRDCIVIGRFPLSILLLMNDSNYPWFILVPMRENIQEIYQLEQEDQALLSKESSYLSQRLADRFKADKMNVAALGNQVPQLHIHHIVRYRADVAWPRPIWGAFATKPYTEDELKMMRVKLKQMLTQDFSFL